MQHITKDQINVIVIYKRDKFFIVFLKILKDYVYYGLKQLIKQS